jgi:hypothetical protein
LILRRAQPSESRELSAWIAARHYLGSSPAGYVFALEFLEGRQRVGAMLLGRPNGRGLDPAAWLELTRVLFIDEAPPNTESRALAMMRRYLRVYCPAVRGLISYSDPTQGHAGTIYAADGWAPFGRTSNGPSGWTSRPGRKAGERQPSKIRWIRTP